MRLLEYHLIWMSTEPLCKHMCLCRQCNEYMINSRDCISPLKIWLKISLSVYFGLCESLVPHWRSTSTFENSCWCTALDMPEWRKTTDQIDWRAKQPKHVACFSEDLKCWEAWDTTCGHKAKDITPLIACSRKALKERALDDLPWKEERRPSWIRRTLEPFQRQRWETSERRSGVHMGFIERIDTILN